ncbi:MAG TPA: hypothetical protein DCZ03_05490, partial [Gammaproteobacteria bacterium]|nr:hypothetical protein [Gammaproteobacteria bacterium]
TQEQSSLRAALVAAVNDSNSFESVYVAEVWLLDMSTRLARWVPDPNERFALLKTVHAEAKRVDISPSLVLAIIETESAFDRFAISVVGAQGLMQIMPFWTKEIGRATDNLFEIQTNLRYGCTIIKHYLDMEKGNLPRALQRYNGSLGKRKYVDKVVTALHDNWRIN